MSDGHPFGTFVRRFLVEHVVTDRNLSSHTQKSYRDSIRLLLAFVHNRYGIEPVDLTVEQVTADVVRAFVAHLKEERGNSAATQGLRLVAIHSLFRLISSLVPELVELSSQIIGIPCRRAETPSVPYLQKEEMDALLAAPDRGTAIGRRDHALLLFLYNSGARADEAARITVADLSFAPTASVRIFGKGRKTRHCPLWAHTEQILRDLLGPRRDGPKSATVFLNVRRERMTRFGIHTMVERNVAKAATKVPSLRQKRVSPHTIRHTTAVHLLRAGVDINTIRAWLGHAQLETTNRYVQVDLEMKARALASCAIEGDDEEDRPQRSPRDDPELMKFLSAL